MIWVEQKLIFIRKIETQIKNSESEKIIKSSIS